MNYGIGKKKGASQYQKRKPQSEESLPLIFICITKHQESYTSVFWTIYRKSTPYVTLTAGSSNPAVSSKLLGSMPDFFL